MMLHCVSLFFFFTSYANTIPRKRKGALSRSLNMHLFEHPKLAYNCVAGNLQLRTELLGTPKEIAETPLPLKSMLTVC